MKTNRMRVLKWVGKYFRMPVKTITICSKLDDLAAAMPDTSRACHAAGLAAIDMADDFGISITDEQIEKLSRRSARVSGLLKLLTEKGK
jgi:hypothetical protein